MKKFLLISTAIILTAVIFYSCKKDATNITTEQQAVQQLLQSESFIEFTKDFVPDITRLMSYHRSIGIQNRSADFLHQVTLADNDDAKLATTYRAFSLNFENAAVLKNKIDNDLLRLLNKNKFLLHFSEAQTQHILFNALDVVRTSTDPKWQEIKAEVNNRMKIKAIKLATQSVRVNLAEQEYDEESELAPGLTWDEIWDCLKAAVGFGTAGVLGIAGLQKLATEGVQEVVITLSKFLAKRAGWFGLAIMLIDLGSCIYKADRT